MSLTLAELAASRKRYTYEDYCRLPSCVCGMKSSSWTRKRSSRGR
ncbi:MAG: hypothetical protein PWP41_2051 [Moorella sp. (in: firmicutes)]|nr:hypothetical protein [Moorella sp. (in: firmicutes)]